MKRDKTSRRKLNQISKKKRSSKSEILAQNGTKDFLMLLGIRLYTIQIFSISVAYNSNRTQMIY